MIRVEAVAVPGSGKSTLFAEVARRLRARGVTVMERSEQQSRVSALHRARSRGERLALLSSFVATHPALVGGVVRLNATTWPPSSRSWYRAYCLLRHAQNRALLDEEGVLLLDQDLLQEILSVLYLRPCRDVGALERVLRALDAQGWLPHVVVHPRVSGAETLARLRSRSASRGPTGEFDRMGDLRAETLDQAREEAARIARAAARIGGGVLVETDGAAPPERQADAVMAAILGRLERDAAESNPDPRDDVPSNAPKRV